MAFKYKTIPFYGKSKSGSKYGFEVFYIPKRRLWTLIGISNGYPQYPVYFKTKQEAIDRAEEAVKINKEYL